MRRFVFIDGTDEAECGDPQQFRGTVVVTGIETRNSPPEKTPIEVLTRRAEGHHRESE